MRIIKIIEKDKGKEGTYDKPGKGKGKAKVPGTGPYVYKAGTGPDAAKKKPPSVRGQFSRFLFLCALWEVGYIGGDYNQFCSRHEPETNGPRTGRR